MQVAVLQDGLAKGLGTVRRAVASRSALPVLGNILLRTDEGRLKLAATNLELGITCWVGAKIDEEGAVTVPANTFADLIGTLPPDQIHMTLDGETQTLKLKCGATTANIKGISAEEFPLMPEAKDESAIRVSPDTIRDMIQQTAFAAATDNSRPILTGVLTKFEKSTLTMAAADGFRLAVRTTELANEVETPTTLIIPARALNEIARISADVESDISLSAPDGRNQVLFHSDNVQVVSQLVDGTFPAYEQIIPRNYATRSIIYTAELLRACRRAEIFARESANTVRIQINPGESEIKPGTLVVRATSQESGDNQVEITAAIAGEAMEIAFNVRYMIDALNVIDTEQVALETNNASSPGVLRPVGVEGYTYVIMPMHIHR
ncbi:MAG: DNA polymerase III subunit beta [Anaerolineae bacterium]|nr:DNA polymerase III subunit beta [Anaerolineae bacterium]